MFKWLISLFRRERKTTTTTSTFYKEGNVKRCLNIGINEYRFNSLKGCINDARNMVNLLESYSFDEPILLLDSFATKENILNEIKNLVNSSRAGDSLVITYSGHGTSVVDEDGDEVDGRDEAWCVYNGTIKDDEIREVISALPQGVKLTILSDSCHSGTISRAFLTTMQDITYYSHPKYMPPQDDVKGVFINSLSIRKAIFTPDENMKEILISGCLATEVSYDAYIEGQLCGAFTYCVIKILKENPKITYNDFYKKLRESLPNNRYPQTPQLEGSIEHKNSIMFG